MSSRLGSKVVLPSMDESELKGAYFSQDGAGGGKEMALNVLRSFYSFSCNKWIEWRVPRKESVSPFQEEVLGVY